MGRDDLPILTPVEVGTKLWRELERSLEVAVRGLLLTQTAQGERTHVERRAGVRVQFDRLAEALEREPLQGLRVVLVSCGAEEVLQGGVYGFCERHLAPLDRERTWMLNLDTVGSPGLVLLEGEGAIVMEDFFDRTWRDLIVAVAERERIPMRRGMRARTSTDSVVPSRMGIPTACLVSINRYKGLSNYHQMSDTPEKISYPTVACAADLAEALARELASPA